MDVKHILVPGLGRRDVSAARTLREDALLAVAAAVAAVVIALTTSGNGRHPDALGWALLMAAHVPSVFRRRAPVRAFLGLVVCVAPYHALDYNHTAPMAVSMTALYTIAVTGRPLRTLFLGAGVLGIMLGVKFGEGMTEGTEALRISGWIVAFLMVGVIVRVHRQYVASVVERAERAERTREEEARRRVAEERLRVARDLHDLLAHSITLVGVQTSVAAHVLQADPDRLDRAAVAKALDDIAETCRTARGELRATLEVLRAVPDDSRGPLPGLDGLPDLAEAARTAGATVDLSVDHVEAPPAVGAAAYRIVQEALTNAVRHGGPGLTVRVGIRSRGDALHLRVADDGAPPPSSPSPSPSAPEPDRPAGFGLLGMRERARSVGGTLDAGPRAQGGFEVAAVLPTGVAR
ncbi:MULTISPECIES: sensor histidine kinase [unclassified Streptomyces]|uniref:sensor histidine kinase n=1 Tax=unclassified Streptomyces TaxID=2593676 RepID=UPI003630EEE8